MSVSAIAQSAAAGNLVVVLGAGATMALVSQSKQQLSWPGLIRSALEYAHARSLISDSQLTRHLEALEASDIDEMLGVAEFSGRKLGSPTGPLWASWLRSVFEELKSEPGAMLNALRAIQGQKVPIATLNYDTVLEGALGLPSVELSDVTSALSWCRKERDGLLHLHGVWSQPSSCIFGIRDYQGTLTDQSRDLIQRSLSSLNRLLFVGCGDTFADPNFSALISWLRTNVGAGAPQHYALVRDSDVSKWLAEPTWRGFVEPLGYGTNFSDLPKFLLSNFPTRSRAPKKSLKRNEAADLHKKTIEAYRSFLLRDCGEMTIEGMRADMDTAQRKFDLEKLFVPLDVVSFPPSIPSTDPDREAKLQAWKEREDSSPKPFAEAFSKHKKVALLALPGGGKTLLLKRLAVAYSDPNRRAASPDKLPELDLVPVMIRCREWKDQIRKPFSVLLESMSSIAGDKQLDGLATALEKPLKSGNVLLLVDGLDEIHNDADRAIFVDNLEKFLISYPKIRLLVTSREAGFELVAPCLGRFCTKFKIAPLNAKAIQALSDHWHRLMSGGSPEAIAEGMDVAKTLLSSDPLRRLAENPLLLTMLLVVKHGAGRLPPDRVALYERAVELLLDTWNIKGHEPLNTKESVPQLACLAFELMRRGAQTATERDILEILEQARELLPMIGRYARDAPHDFLKRVELRSSLLLEGGHKSENGRTVPFYQFRHLTFQEYLAAVATVDGYVLPPNNSTEPLDSIRDKLLSDDWKEVVPMAAVLARTRAAPLLEALVVAAEAEWKASRDRSASQDVDYSQPPATSRLGQAMTEEAIFPTGLLSRAASIVTYFGAEARPGDYWQALSRGPYGPELRAAALENYMSGDFLTRNSARNTLSWLEGQVRDAESWTLEASFSEAVGALSDSDRRQRVWGLASIGGSFLVARGHSYAATSTKIYELLEELIFEESDEVCLMAVWAWGFWRHLKIIQKGIPPIPPSSTVSRLVSLFLQGYSSRNQSISFVVADLRNVSPDNTSFTISAADELRLREITSSALSESPIRTDDRTAMLRTAYLLPSVVSREELDRLTKTFSPMDIDRERLDDVYAALGMESHRGRRRSVIKSMKPA